MMKWLVLISVLFCTACDNRSKASAEKAPGALAFMLPLIDRDTKQVRDGLPNGAAALAKLLDEDPGRDPEGLRRSIEKARGGVTELAIAKSTFFSFVGTDGVVLRSEADPDLAAGQSLFTEIPAAKAILDKPGMTEVFGSMHGLRGVQKGADLQWVVGHRIDGADGKVLGAFITGWSFRKYADFLENALRQHLTDTSENKKRPAPLVYVFFARGDKAYGGAVTPDVDADAVAALGLPGQVGDGLFQSSLTVEGQSFALVARKVPALDKDTVLVVLLAVV